MSTNFSRKKSKAGLNSNQGGGSNNGSQLGGPSGGGNFSTINAGSGISTAKKTTNQPNNKS